MRPAPDDELLRLLAGTNDLRRRFGQAVWLLHRSLTIGRGERAFGRIVAIWASAAASTFRREEDRLARLSPHAPDARLRRLASAVLGTLAGDVEAGDARLVPCLRSLESALDVLVRLLREDAAAPPVHDLDLARALHRGALAWSSGSADATAASMRFTARAVTQTSGLTSSTSGTFPQGPRARGT